MIGLLQAEGVGNNFLHTYPYGTLASYPELISQSQIETVARKLKIRKLISSTPHSMVR